MCGGTSASLYLSMCGGGGGNLCVPLPEQVCVGGLGCPFT